MKIVCDTREQKPYDFTDFTDVELVKGTLPQGDYSIQGLENFVAVERKSLSDLAMCLGRDRDRFIRELLRARGMESFSIVCEGTWAALSKGQYPSRLNPESAKATVCAIMARLKIPIVFCGSRKEAESVTHNLLRQYLRGAMRKAEVVQAATLET